MELQEITTEGKRIEETEGPSESMMETNTESTRNLIKSEEAEPDPYSKLQSPSEDIYSEAFHGGAPVKMKAGKQTAGNTRLYRAACVFLTIICLVLLLVVIILSVKLQTGSTMCPEKEGTVDISNRQSPSFAPTCSREQCQARFSNIQPQYLGCRQCADGWLTFGPSCFFLSTFRLSWDESQRNCSARGGSLAVVTSQTVQRFLTREGKMKYWIGLRHKGETWTWVNNTALQESYWAAQVTSEGDCGILNSGNPPEKNWVAASCQAYTYFICQLQLQQHLSV